MLRFKIIESKLSGNILRNCINPATSLLKTYYNDKLHYVTERVRLYSNCFKLRLMCISFSCSQFLIEFPCRCSF